MKQKSGPPIWAAFFGNRVSLMKNLAIPRSPMATFKPHLSRGSIVALIVAGTFFMENLDATVILTALPQMATSFHVRAVDMNIGVSAYLLALAVLIPLSGWMADRFSVRTVFTSAIVIFTVASMLCGICHNLTSFTLARILQGAGGAMMVPIGRLAVLRTARKDELINAIATITWPGLAAPLLGPPLGGFITTYFSWHWIFFLNLPLGALALFAAFRLFPRSSEHIARPFDAVGFVLTGVACFSLIYGMEMISRVDSSRNAIAATLLGTVIIWLAAAFHARRHPHSLVDLSAMSIPSYSVTIWGGTLSRISLFAFPFLLTLLFQIGFGFTAFRAGLLMLAMFAGNLGMKPMTTPILRRLSFRTTLIGNGALSALVIVSYAYLTPTTPLLIVLVLVFAGGLSRSMQMTAINTLAFADVPKTWMTGANTFYSMIQQMGMAMGIAFGALSLRLAGMFAPGSLSATPSLHVFRIAFFLVGAMGILPIIEALALDRSAGDNVRQPRIQTP